MIVIYHYKNKVTKIIDLETNTSITVVEESIVKTLFLISKLHKDRFIIWCNLKLENSLNVNQLKTVFHHKLIMSSYCISDEIFNPKIGYVEQSVFINMKKNVPFSTWFMSTNVGGMNASVINKCSDLKNTKSFKLFLNVVSKQGIEKGLICSLEPKLLNSNFKKEEDLEEKINLKELFAFVRKLYKKQWQFLLFFNVFIYEKKLPLFSFLISFFRNIKTQKPLNLEDINVLSSKKETTKNNFSIDVIIPTLGRENYLKDVLLDLNKQTILPKKVIIVEQNPDKNSISKLEYLNDNWNFEIDHTFIHQLGACNARNIALEKVTSNYIFFADDDIRFENDLLEKSFQKFTQYQTDAILISCLQKGEKSNETNTILATTFGSGTSIVKSVFVKKCSFKKEHELGYGEDADFGMQLRNLGTTIIAIPSIKMLHLKAPIGGFRHKPTLAWEKENPKPSPTVMAHHLKHYTKEQLLGYKTMLFIKFYRRQSIKNPFKYITSMKKRWTQSVLWANKLMQNEV